MLECSKDNARLAPISSCHELRLLQEELIEKKFDIGDIFYVGIFGSGLTSDALRRRSMMMDDFIDS